MVIKRFSNMLGSRHGANPFSRSRSNDAAEEADPGSYGDDTPEGNAARGVRLFCESGGPNNQGEEVLHLPTIVEAAESSPSAAKVAAQTIRKFLSKDNYPRPHVQYNAIMLIRILADNPGASFTRNLDAKFTATVKELLRSGRDASVQQILRETLQALYMEKAYDTNLQTLFQMWTKESGVNISHSARTGGGGQHAGGSSRHRGQQQHGLGAEQQSRGLQLPPPVELAARIEEAKTSAKLLQQLVQSTPPSELQDHDLIKEFAERCQNAQRSMQAFMNSSNPSPDDDTMQTLIETSEQLSLAASKHQRAVLQARRSGHTASPPPVPPPNGNGQAPQLPPLATGAGNTGYSSPTAAPSSTFTPSATHDLQSYSPPPAPPSVLRKALQRRSIGGDSSAAPPSLRPGGPPTGPPPAVSRLGVDTNDDPFADDNHVYQPPARAPPPANNTHNRTSLEPISASSYGGDDEEIYRGPYGGSGATGAQVSPRPPAPRAPQDSWRRDDAGSPQSYNPGYHSTPSYVKRQESSGENLTMHGAAIDAPEPGTETVPESRVLDSAGRYGRVSPEETRASAPPQGDVSPVESRYNPVSPQSAGTGYGNRY